MSEQEQGRTIRVLLELPAAIIPAFLARQARREKQGLPWQTLPQDLTTQILDEAIREHQRELRKAGSK